MYWCEWVKKKEKEEKDHVEFEQCLSIATKNEEKGCWTSFFFHTPASEMSHNCIHMCAMTSFIAIIVKHELL